MVVVACSWTGGAFSCRPDLAFSRDRLEQPLCALCYSYQLPVAPRFLSEDLALAWAKESLATVINDPSNWKPVVPLSRAAAFAPDGIRDTYLMRDRGTNWNQGVLLFESTRKTNESWIVTVVLNSNRLECTVARKR